MMQAGFYRIASASIAALALFVAPARDALAQQGATNLTSIRNLDFGSFVSGSGGTVTVGTTGARSRTGTVVLLNAHPGGQAAFTASRNGNKNPIIASITLPPSATIRHANGVNSMTLNNFVSSPVHGATTPNPVTVSVGATLTVGQNQAPGLYTGTFSVTVNLN